MQSVAKKAVHSLFDAAGLKVSRGTSVPFGAYPEADLARLARGAAVIFDIGANIGQTVDMLRPVFPRAQIHAFEPIPAAYAVLANKLARDPRARAVQCAMGDRQGEARMSASGSSGQNTLNVDAHPDWDTVTVRISTVDAYAAENGI